MRTPPTPHEDRPAWWRSLWWRAGLLHPAGFVAPWVVLCVAQAERSGSDVADVSWGFWAIPPGAFASFIASAVMAARHPLTTADRVLIVLLGLVAGVVAFVLGELAWLEAAVVACHGGYECPF